jgi:hypothetical protein
VTPAAIFPDPAPGFTPRLRMRHSGRRSIGVSDPVVWIVDSEHWPRACLRAELIERGYDALGFETLADALVRLVLPGSPGPRVVVIDLTDQPVDRRQLESFVRAGAALIGIAGAVEVARPAQGNLPWTVLLQRPVSLGEIAGCVARLLRGAEMTASR